MRGKGYDGVPAVNPGVIPPRMVFPDSVDVVVGSDADDAEGRGTDPIKPAVGGLSS